MVTLSQLQNDQKSSHGNFDFHAQNRSKSSTKSLAIYSIIQSYQSYHVVYIYPKFFGIKNRRGI